MQQLIFVHMAGASDHGFTIRARDVASHGFLHLQDALAAHIETEAHLVNEFFIQNSLATAPVQARYVASSNTGSPGWQLMFLFS
jgi:hypothetical protein